MDEITKLIVEVHWLAAEANAKQEEVNKIMEKISEKNLKINALKDKK